MVWTGIIADNHTDLHVFDRDSLTGQWYRDEVLALCIRLFHRPNFTFLDDNASPYRAQLVDKNLQLKSIQRLEWPVMSPNFNPFGPVWDVFGR
ncbi:dna-mediated transposase [Trichonephila clavipes]|nr:dna-mediated transposase [Trichonephila clavipes]